MARALVKYIPIISSQDFLFSPLLPSLHVKSTTKLKKITTVQPQHPKKKKARQREGASSSAGQPNCGMVKDGWADRPTFQQSYGLDMSPGIEEGGSHDSSWVPPNRWQQQQQQQD
ncbi:hypothetical protein M406DRAFT_70526 [Cryphonectria parasitica EP155]|uniref:Uncharacterized protein n=1 Tax=Cryphonectria parasitica (strain ATCC 38755 / EP155) TaxID=660469 RepID=A0A9P4Y1Z3_CRYP1|nr:uncharacterized protein M406DRAFT_70526 [Cryphonectria parasitica EP155]KAF3764965.1 hypothetical protein M406DRAFT_70526 [Cryphonectria parasitica EP155]